MMRRLFGSVAFQFLCLIAVVILYNRVVYALHSVSGQAGFSAWAAPLYAAPMPLPGLSMAQIQRSCVPVVIAIAWIMTVMRWMKEETQGPGGRDSIVATDASPWSANHGLAPVGTMSADRATASHSITRKLLTALCFILLVNLTTCMMDAGAKSITWPFSRIGDEYFGDAEHLDTPLKLLRDYPTMTLSRHAHTHPPGGVLLLWVVRKTIGEGLMPASLAAIVLTAMTIIPATLLAWRFLSTNTLTIFLGLYALTPNLVLFGATSMDGVFALVLVTAAYFFFRTAMTRSSPQHTVLAAIHVGLWLALSSFFTYATIALIALFVVWWMLTRFDLRIFVILAIAAITMIAIYAMLYVTTGCNILACARSSIAFDKQLMSDVRPHYWDVSFTNLLGFLVGSGFIAATLWMRSIFARSSARKLSIALAIAIAVLSFSTLFTRELERVWMFLTPLLLIGAADELDRRSKWIIPGMALLFAQTWLTQLLLNTIW